MELPEHIEKEIESLAGSFDPPQVPSGLTKKAMMTRIALMCLEVQALPVQHTRHYGFFKFTDGDVWYNDVLLTLDKKARYLLEILLKSPGKLHRRESLIAKLWPEGVDSRVVDSYLARTRKELRAKGFPIAAEKMSVTIYGEGFCAHPDILKQVAPG